MPAYPCKIATRPLNALVQIPGSKSITNRALIASALADGTSLLSGILLADDTRYMMEALGALGISITIDEKKQVAEITGCHASLPQSEARIFCGNAGTVMRFCTALSSTGTGRFELCGTDRMHERPIAALTSVLQSLGCGVEFLQKEGYPPLVVHAKGLRGGVVTLDDAPSSQFISALLLAAPTASSDVFVELRGQMHSRPYLSMTTAIMERFGVSVIEDMRGPSTKFIIEAPQRYQPTQLRIEPDASNASYFLAAPAVVEGRVAVEGLGVDSLQGDVRFVDILERMGCKVARDRTKLSVTSPPVGTELRGVDVDLNDMPDTVQTLAVVALFANGPTTIRNVANLRIKETDRLDALATELSKLGAVVEVKHDGLTINPPTTMKAARIDTYNDHRMAMSFALAGLKCPGIEINDPDCCGKSFPTFFELWERHFCSK